MMELLFIVLCVLFVISLVGWIVSLFFMRITMVPMWIFVILINVLNIGIQITTIFSE